MLRDARSRSIRSLAENELESGYDFMSRCGQYSVFRGVFAGDRLISQFRRTSNFVAALMNWVFFRESFGKTTLTQA